MTTQTKTTWREMKLGDVADFQYGYTASAKEENSGTKFLRITDIVPDIIDWEAVPFCDIEEEKLDQYKIHKGDILIARTGASGEKLWPAGKRSPRGHTGQICETKGVISDKMMIWRLSTSHCSQLSLLASEHLPDSAPQRLWCRFCFSFCRFP